jgi:hypothetical protein
MGNQERLTALLLEEMRAQHATMTELVAKLTGRAVNGVLDVQTITFDSTGMWTRGYGTTIGSVLVCNPSTSASVTVLNGAPSTSGVPTTGTGVQVLPPGSYLPVPIDSRAFTVYGTAGQVVSFQVFTGLQALGVSAR